MPVVTNGASDVLVAALGRPLDFPTLWLVTDFAIRTHFKYVLWVYAYCRAREPDVAWSCVTKYFASDRRGSGRAPTLTALPDRDAHHRAQGYNPEFEPPPGPFLLDYDEILDTNTFDASLIVASNSEFDQPSTAAVVLSFPGRRAYLHVQREFHI